MVTPTLDIEEMLWQKGIKFIAGVDEVGRGAWAGPLVVSAVILPRNFQILDGLADSKLLKPSKRISLAKIIRQQAVSISIVEISSSRIDKVKLTKASHEAFRKAVRSLTPRPDFCLIDAFYIKHFSRKHQLAVKNGDKFCASIAAASIIAKVHRDTLMEKLHFKFSKWGFSEHKGYGTKMHQDAIRNFGFSKIHRKFYDLGYLLP